MKTTTSQLTDTRAFLQRTLKGGTFISGERVSRPGSGLPATNWSASKGSSEKKQPLFQRESPRGRVKNQAPSIQALKQLSTNLFGSPRSQATVSRPPLNMPNPVSRPQQENLVSFRPYDAPASVKRQIDFTE
jgi:hypothetical protein